MGADFQLDCKGLKCPQPVIRIRRYMSRLESGQTVLVECTDELSMIDVPHFVTTANHKLISMTRDNEAFRFIIQKG